MPRHALQELKPELQEQNIQHDNEGIEEQNAVADQNNDEPYLNDVEDTRGRHDEERNNDSDTT